MSRRITFGLINTFGNPSEWHQPWHERYAQILEQTEWIDKMQAMIAAAMENVFPAPTACAM